MRLVVEFQVWNSTTLNCTALDNPSTASTAAGRPGARQPASSFSSTGAHERQLAGVRAPTYEPLHRFFR